MGGIGRRKFIFSRRSTITDRAVSGNGWGAKNRATRDDSHVWTRYIGSMETPRPATKSPAMSLVRRLLRPKFSLRTLLVGMAVVGAGLGMFVRLDLPRQLIARISADGGGCQYFYKRKVSVGRFESWLRTRLPRSYFDDIFYVALSKDTKNVDRIVGHLAGLNSLEYLLLDNTQVRDAGLAHLAWLKSLYGLNLDNTQIGDAGLSHLTRLRSLGYLHLANTQVSDAGLAHLTELNSLQELCLYKTQIGDLGLKHLAGLESLEVLNLNKTQVTDAGLAHLAGLKSLEYFHLANTQVSDEGLKYLADKKILKLLDLTNTKVGPAGIQQLRTKLPDCRIFGP